MEIHFFGVFGAWLPGLEVVSRLLLETPGLMTEVWGRDIEGCAEHA